MSFSMLNYSTVGCQIEIWQSTYVLGHLDQAELRGVLGDEGLQFLPSTALGALKLLEVLHAVHSLLKHAIGSRSSALRCCLFHHLIFISIISKLTR